MAAPKYRNPQQESEHLGTLAKMLREMDEHLAKETGGTKGLPKNRNQPPDGADGRGR